MSCIDLYKLCNAYLLLCTPKLKDQLKKEFSGVIKNALFSSIDFIP